jgi:hypothetical protein
MYIGKSPLHAGFFYVQEERYAAVAGMHRSGVFGW